ncbi:MAG: hypothetical protein HOV67_28120, partial [Kribbellaceae bacterium]|nr:hypothetical protein [Kribbellaceae bacterium]
VDRFEPARMPGRSGKPQLYVHNTDWFGVVNGRRGIILDRIYYRWIHNYRYGRNW